MHILLFIFYSLLCGYGILKIPFVRKAAIPPGLLIGLFTLHVLTGCLHNVIAWRYYPEHGDIWRLFQFSLSDRHLLTSQFDRFIADNSRWTYFSHNGINFVLIIVNFFSFNNLYIDTLLFAFPVFLGNIALYRMFRRRFPADPLTAASVFLLPSTLFWTSCIHREGVLYMSLGFLFYLLDRIFAPAPFISHGRRRYLYACCCFLLIVYFRAEVGVLLVPALLIWWFIEKPLPRRQTWLLAGACTAIVVILLSVPSLSALPLNLLTHQQNEFRELEGHSRLYLPALDGSWNSLLHVLPAAALNGLFEPLPGSGGQPIYLAFSVELILIWIIVLTASIFRLIPGSGRIPPAPPASGGKAFGIGALLFSLLGMLLIGTIVPFAGAIVRYRSLYIPFLLAPCLHSLACRPPFRQLNRRLNAWLPDPNPGSKS